MTSQKHRKKIEKGIQRRTTTTKPPKLKRKSPPSKLTLPPPPDDEYMLKLQNDPASFNLADALDYWRKRLTAATAPSMNAECYLITVSTFDRFMYFLRDVTAAVREVEASDAAQTNETALATATSLPR